LTVIVHKIFNGAILYDNTVISDVRDDLFVPDSWTEVNSIPKTIGGRGQVFFVGDSQGKFVMRHFVRGGMAAKFSYDAYIWTGKWRTRSFEEWRLIRKLLTFNLPVPVPVAAHFIKKGMFYTADIITQEIPNVKSLASYVITGNIFENFWKKVGAHIYKFHNVGLCHADLNAYNILIDEDTNMWLIDFDKSKILSPGGGWRHDNLKRLKRSLKKICNEKSSTNFKPSDWLELLDGYSHASRSL
jgi:3-deoxy-D-manno-octulosonic acid kinase